MEICAGERQEPGFGEMCFVIIYVKSFEVLGQPDIKGEINKKCSVFCMPIIQSSSY